MKHLHKFASVLLALVMALSLMVPAFAATTEPVNNPNHDVKGPLTITISNVSQGHTYEAYQIFKGNVSDDVTVDQNGATTAPDLIDAVLSNIEWGAGVNATEAQRVAAEVFPAVEADPDKNIEAVSAPTNAAEVAARLATASSEKVFEFAQKISKCLVESPNASSDKVTGDVTANTTATITVTSTGAGYYLVKDVADDETGTSQDVSLFMLQVVGPAKVVSKVGTPEPDKKVKDANDSTDATDTENSWQDSADHDINDIIDYQLTAKLPANIANYKTYKLTFTDNMSKGLTLVDKQGNEITDKYLSALEIYVAELDVDGKLVKVENATVTDPAVSYSPYTGTNTNYTGGNTLTITFDDITGFTPKDADGNSTMSNKVIVVEYKAKLNQNAAFANPNGLTLKYPSDPNHTGEGGDNPPEGETPEKVAIVFTFTGVVDKIDKDKKPLAGAEFTLYKWDNDAQEDENNEKWVAVGNETLNTVTDEGTKFSFKGLDDGRYKLVETKVPAGYNKADDIIFEIATEHGLNKETQKLEVTSFKIIVITKDANGTEKKTEYDGSNPQTNDAFKITANPTDGGNNFNTQVQNLQGTVLPETGGIGTTIFYIVGGLLTVGAVVLLVTKKRMSVDSDK